MVTGTLSVSLAVTYPVIFHTVILFTKLNNFKISHRPYHIILYLKLNHF